MPNITFRCPHCKTQPCEVANKSYDGIELMVSECCDEVAERVYLCVTCGERESHNGCDDCFPCVVESIIADPRALEMCAEPLRLEIGKALAARLQPFLTRRQAA